MSRRTMRFSARVRCRASRARGYTLIELLVAIVVGGAILTVAATLMSRVLAANSTAEEHLRAIESLGEIGRRFREDIHHATVANIESTQPPRLLLTLDDGSQVHYEGTPSGAARVHSADDKPQRHEAYALGQYKVLGFRTGASESGDSDTDEVQLLLGRVSSRPDDDTATGAFAITAVAAGTNSAAQPQEAPAP